MSAGRVLNFPGPPVNDLDYGADMTIDQAAQRLGITKKAALAIPDSELPKCRVSRRIVLVTERDFREFVWRHRRTQ